MAELGHTSDPTALIPGNPEAIEENVIAVRGRGRSLEAAGGGLGLIDTGAWEGDAGTRFREKFSYEPPKWLRAADAFEATAAALEGYADTLRWAQRQAQEAIARWEQGEQATQQARARHDAAVAQATAQNQANAAHGNPTVLKIAPFVDPGEQHREAARAILHRARQQLTEAGDVAAGAIRVQNEQAPDEPGWLEDVGGFLGEVGIGVWEGIKGMGELVVTYSPTRLLYDSEGWVNDTRTLAQGLVAAGQNPIEFGKALIDWDTWSKSPGRAIGHLVPDLAISLATAGAGGVAARAGKGGLKAADEMADPGKGADEIADTAKVADEAPTPPGDGPVTFRPPPNATPEEVAQVQRYVEACERAREAGALSDTGRVSTAGELREAASEAARAERLAAKEAGQPYSGHVGHAPDTTWTGKPDAFEWHDQTPRVNSSLGAQARRYPVGHQPSNFEFEGP
ncbi:putative T7SS-secreted protein [Amycolatopsis aidingensis]|uniref:putative T7SS-secreted protein n=1 Tax=Amycolatopsis aidingensis TaxID=2842453 RepID=UPI001C0B624D|nr:hypothetical protein [Amycolatopsis aidingensis]